MVGDKPTELINMANRELLNFSNWCLANKLTVSISKTHYMLFPMTITNCQPLAYLTLLNDNILQVDQITFLCITCYKNLTFKHHISKLCLKFLRTIPLLLKVNTLPQLKYSNVNIMRTYIHISITVTLSGTNLTYSTA